MDEKGRRFASDDKIIELHPNGSQGDERERAKRENKDKRLKDKNSKKLQKLLKKQKRIEMRNLRKFPDEHEPAAEDKPQDEPAEEELREDVPETIAPGREEREEQIVDVPQENVVTEDEPDADDIDDEEERNVREIAEETAEEPRPSVSRAQYNDLPPRKKKKLPKKRIVAAGVIVVLLFCIVYYAFNTDKFSFHNISNFFQYGVLNRRSDERFPLDIKGERVSAGNFSRLGQDICYSSDTKTLLLNNYGRSSFSVQHAFINPVLTTGDKGALVYNLGGTGYQLIDREGAVFSAEAKDDLLAADYGDNGYYALVTQSSGYLSKLYIYDDNNEQIYAYSFFNYYVTSVCLNSNGTKAVVSGVSALNGSEIAALYVLDFTKEDPQHFLELENDIIYQVKYLSDKYACAVGRAASYSLNTATGDIQKNDYNGRDLTAFDINEDTNTYTVSLSNSGDGRNCDIISYSINGTEEKSFSVDDKKIINLSTYKGRVALLTNDSVMLYSKDGRAYSEKELNSDPHSVVLYTSSNAYILCTGYIDAISL